MKSYIKKVCLSLLTLLPICATATIIDAPKTITDSIASIELAPQTPAEWHKKPKYISIKYDQGQAFKTNKYLKVPGRELGYKALSAKFGFSQPADSWEYIDGHKKWNGIGVYVPFFDNDEFGHPFSLFLLQGGNIAEFNQRLHLQYEWNVGYTFNWTHYDPIEHPDNITIGAKETFHIGANLFLEWQPTKNFDIKVGGGLTHFSNGAAHIPNKGLNLLSPMVELSYRWDDPDYVFNGQSSKEIRDIYNIHKPTAYDKHWKHEFTFTVSKRQKQVDTTRSDYKYPYIDHDFRVFAFSYAPMHCSSRTFAYGPSLDISYDETNHTDVRSITTKEGIELPYIELGEVKDRFQVGLSVKGEMNMHYFTYFANFGYDLYHYSHSPLNRCYQILGLQFHPTKHVFGTMGIRALKFCKAQYVYWSLGYSLDQKHKDHNKITVE